MADGFHFRPIASNGEIPAETEIGQSCPSLSGPCNSIQGESAILANGPRDVLRKILRNKPSRTKPLNNLISGTRYADYLLIA